MNDVIQARDRTRLLVERMRKYTEFMSADEIAVATHTPRSTCYKMLKELDMLGVVEVANRAISMENRRASTIKVYRLNVVNADIYTEPIMGQNIPQIFNKLSKKYYTLLDLCARYDPDVQTGGAKAADAYMVVAIELLNLSFEDPTSVESAKKRLELRQYLQHALVSANNTVSSIKQMLDDPRLWNEHLHVLSSNDQVKQNKDLIKDRASRVNPTTN